MDLGYLILGFVLLIILMGISIIINFILDKRSKTKIMKWLKSPEAIQLYKGSTISGEKIVELLNQVPEIKLHNFTIKKNKTTSIGD